MKLKPKSCNCRQCSRGKGTKAQAFMMKKAERAFRHFANQKARREEEDIPLATYGSYTD